MKASKVDECHLTIALVVPEGGISEDTNDVVIIWVSICPLVPDVMMPIPSTACGEAGGVRCKESQRARERV